MNQHTEVNRTGYSIWDV